MRPVRHGALHVRAIQVREVIVLLPWRLSRELRRVLAESKQTSAITSSEMMKRFELLLQCGF